MHIPENLKHKLLSESAFSDSLAGGPGGQHVNKVSTKIELRFPVSTSQYLNEVQKQRVLTKLKNRINSAGELILTSGSERSQWRNKEKVIQKFFNLLEIALNPPK